MQCIFITKKKLLLINVSTVDNCLFPVIRSESKKCFFNCAFHSLSEGEEEFEFFCRNASYTNWWNGDITNWASREIAFLATIVGYKQIIDRPTHVINNSMLCNAPIFFIKQKLVLKHCVDASIFEKDHWNRSTK